MAQLLFADARRPDLKRSDSMVSQASLPPTPPDTVRYGPESPDRVGGPAMDVDDPFAAPDAHASPTPARRPAAAAHVTPPSFVRPRTNRPRNADRITKQAAAAYREQSEAARLDPDNPFLERPGELHRGKSLAARDAGVVDYVLCVGPRPEDVRGTQPARSRGKRISFDSAYYAPQDVCEAAGECPPKLLFPTAERSPERQAPMATPSAKRPLTPPRVAVPPTPESVVRKPNAAAGAARRYRPYAPVSVGLR